MATFAVGDVHGHAAPLSGLLSRLRTEVADGDSVVFLGDYIDRGLESRACVDEIVAFRRGIRADVVCLRGNHEDWLLKTLSDFTEHSWLLGMEPFETIRSYSQEAAAAIRSAMSEAGLRLYITKYELPYRLFVDAMPASHREFFAGLALYHETPDCICTHAGIDPAVHVLADQPPRALVWGVASFPAEYDGDTPVVYGHRNNATAGADGWPMPNVVGNTIGVDTISHGVLTALRLPDRTVFQSDGTKTRSVVL